MLKKSTKPVDQPAACDSVSLNDTSSGSQLQFEFPSGEYSVRNALSTLRGALADKGFCPNDLGAVEIVLAEVLNNVVEHAYAAQASGRIGLSCRRMGPVLRFRVEDTGSALPLERLPEGQLPVLGQGLEALPEGGFGWYLVRHLACDLMYQRIDGRNVLAFSIPFETQNLHSGKETSSNCLNQIKASPDSNAKT